MWYLQEGFLGGNNASAKMWYTIAKNTNATLTITCANASDLGVSVHNYTTHINTSYPLNSIKCGLESSAGLSHTSKGIITSSATIIVAYWGEEYETTTCTATGSWIKRTEQIDHEHSTFDETEASIGTYTSTMNSSSSETFLYMIAAFNTVSSGGSSAPNSMPHILCSGDNN